MPYLFFHHKKSTKCQHIKQPAEEINQELLAKTCVASHLKQPTLILTALTEGQQNHCIERKTTIWNNQIRTELIHRSNAETRTKHRSQIFLVAAERIAQRNSTKRRPRVSLPIQHNYCPIDDYLSKKKQRSCKSP